MGLIFIEEVSLSFTVAASPVTLAALLEPSSQGQEGSDSLTLCFSKGWEKTLFLVVGAAPETATISFITAAKLSLQQL